MLAISLSPFVLRTDGNSPSTSCQEAGRLLLTALARPQPGVLEHEASRVAALDPTLIAPLGLHRLLQDGQLFLRVQRISPAELYDTYTVHVPGARMRLSGGFLSGQPAD
jgi:hypothetical protein